MRTPKEMYLYFIRCGNTQIVKVGVTKDIKKRLSTFQDSNPYILKVVARIYFPNSIDCFAIESYIKRFLRDKRMRGEWFRVNEYDLKVAITRAKNLTKRAKQIRINNFLFFKKFKLLRPGQTAENTEIRLRHFDNKWYWSAGGRGEEIDQKEKLAYASENEQSSSKEKQCQS